MFSLHSFITHWRFAVVKIVVIVLQYFGKRQVAVTMKLNHVLEYSQNSHFFKISKSLCKSKSLIKSCLFF